MAFLVFFFGSCRNADSLQQEPADIFSEVHDVSGKLNIILILADDMSYAIPADTAGRNLSLPNELHPNKYSFTVHASHKGKTWNKPVVIRSDIAVPLFPSWWLYALLGLLSVAGFHFLFRFRLQQQSKLLRLRNRIHRDLHDDVGATLSSVKVYSEILKDNPDTPLIAELIKENATEMIDRLEVISWAADPHHDDFGSFIDKLNRFARPLCFLKNIHYNINSNGVSRDIIIPGEIRQNLFLIIKEAINNT